jgi:arginine deiminase
MKAKAQAIIDMCLDDGLAAAVYNSEPALTDAQMISIIEKAKHEIWLQLDTYFTFTDNDND